MLGLAIRLSLCLLCYGSLGAGKLSFERDERLEHAVLVTSLGARVNAIETQSLR